MHRIIITNNNNIIIISIIISSISQELQAEVNKTAWL